MLHKVRFINLPNIAGFVGRTITKGLSIKFDLEASLNKNWINMGIHYLSRNKRIQIKDQIKHLREQI